MSGLRGIPPVLACSAILGPLVDAGHGETILIADRGFPFREYCPSDHIVHVHGAGIPVIFEAILQLRGLDSTRYNPFPVKMMQILSCDRGNQTLVDVRHVLQKAIQTIINGSLPQGEQSDIQQVERLAFYELARAVSLCIHTDQDVAYGNVLVSLAGCG